MFWSMDDKSAVLSELDLHRLKWLLGGGLAMIALWSLVSINFSGQGLVLPLLLVLAVALVRPGWPGWLPKFFWVALTPVLILVVALDFLFSVQGGDTIAAILRMSALLAFVRGLQYRRRREDLQLALLALFALVISGVLTTSLLFAVQMVIFSPLAMAFLFVVNLLEAGKGRVLTRADWAGFSWVALVVALRRVLDARFVGLVMGLFVLMAGMGTVIFVSLPRFEIEQAFDLFEVQPSGVVGFTDRVSFGQVNELSTDDALAMRVQPPSLEAVPLRPYWRIVVLDRHVGGEFIASAITDQGFGRHLDSGVSSYRSDLRRGAGPDGVTWQFFLEPGVADYLPVMGTFAEVRFSKSMKLRLDEERWLFRNQQPGFDRFGYQLDGVVISDRLPATKREKQALAGVGPVPDVFNEQGKPTPLEYPLTTLGVPKEGPALEALRGMVGEIVGDATAGGSVTGEGQLSTLDFARRATAWLQQRYRYALEDTARYEDADYPIVDWLLTGRQGWCEHFAASLVLLARTAGIPARLVVGYAGAEWNTAAGYLVIRQSTAHAWVELFDGEDWVRHDPTPAIGLGALGEEDLAGLTTIGSYTGWDAWVDSLRMAWYRRVINFDQVDQAQVAEALKNEAVNFFEGLKEKLAGWRDGFRDWWNRGWSVERLVRTLVPLLGVAGLAVALWKLRFWIEKLIWRERVHRRRIARIRREAAALLRRYRRRCPDRVMAEEGIAGAPMGVPKLEAMPTGSAGSLAEPDGAQSQLREDLLAIRFGDLGTLQDPQETLRLARLYLSQRFR